MLKGLYIIAAAMISSGFAAVLLEAVAALTLVAVIVIRLIGR